MKQCNRCTESKPLVDFCVRTKSKDGRQPYCRDCSKNTFKRYYKTNSGAYRERAKKVFQETFEMVKELKDNQPCTDCKVRYPYYVLQYDHLSSKKKDIGKLCTYGTATVLKEIAKCELVCGNCHAVRTYKRATSP